MTAFKNSMFLALAQEDKTFNRENIRGKDHYVGKCIHCNSKIMIEMDGKTVSATIEHITPKTHGGSDDLENLALSCRTCNNQKGCRLDNKNSNDPKLLEVIERLKNRKQDRKRCHK